LATERVSTAPEFVRRSAAGSACSRARLRMMSELRSFAVLLVSASEYRIDGSFRYTADELPKVGDLITVEDELGGSGRHARVRRVSPDERYPIHATDATELSPERSVGPGERSRRESKKASARSLAARSEWLRRRRHRGG
jgi:hypothetical protein